MAAGLFLFAGDFTIARQSHIDRKAHCPARCSCGLFAIHLAGLFRLPVLGRSAAYWKYRFRFPTSMIPFRSKKKSAPINPPKG
jgi:hypothetical protein